MRWLTRCALQRPLSNSLSLVLLAMFVLGAVAFGAGTYWRHRLDRAPSPPQWPTLVDETLTDAGVEQRRDMIERLALVGSPWSRSVLERALDDERDESIRALIRSSLT